jgi:predicted RNase H-like HicB family nuclease
MTKNIVSKIKDHIQVNIEIVLFKEGETWIAYSPALELASYGDSLEDAKHAFHEMIDIFLEETNRKGSLEKYLLKLGWQLQQRPKPKYNQPDLKTLKNKSILFKNSRTYTEKVSIPVS